MSAEIYEIFNDEHQELLSRINYFCDKLSKTPLDHEAYFMISEVHAAIAAHFKSEEEVMRRHHDANYNKHKVDHDSLLDELKNLMEKVDAGPTENLGRALAVRCVAWLAVHFEEHDKQFLAKDGAIRQQAGPKNA